jgi:hypothetical protein
MFHLVCYLREEDRVFETYWTNGRGVEAMGNSTPTLSPAPLLPARRGTRPRDDGGDPHSIFARLGDWDRTGTLGGASTNAVIPADRGEDVRPAPVESRW